MQDFNSKPKKMSLTFIFADDFKISDLEGTKWEEPVTFAFKMLLALVGFSLFFGPIYLFAKILGNLLGINFIPVGD